MSASKTQISLSFSILVEPWKSFVSILGAFGRQLCVWIPRGSLQDPFWHQNKIMVFLSKATQFRLNKTHVFASPAAPAAAAAAVPGGRWLEATEVN